jgi:hypothetical protein
MATIEVDVDIEDHLDEISTIDLIDELKDRDGIAKLLTDNLADEMKLEEFLEKFKNIPQAELTTFLNNYK